MLCLDPQSYGTSGPFACGKCEGCRINRRRDWTARLLLHHAGHVGASAFVTLTYDDKHLPLINGVGTLSRGDAKNFCQRLRREIGDVRYVLVGEYGERTWRPHYHALLWYGDVGASAEWIVSRCWSEGYISVGEVSVESVQYTVSYILKRMVSPEDVRLEGRVPEFARFSHGLGVSALVELKRVARVNGDGCFELPREFRLQGRVWPIPKYLRRKLEEDGYVFTRVSSEREEEAFVRSLSAGSRAVAWDSIIEFRSAVREELEKRRVNAAIRVNRRLIGRSKYETL